MEGKTHGDSIYSRTVVQYSSVCTLRVIRLEFVALIMSAVSTVSCQQVRDHVYTSCQPVNLTVLPTRLPLRPTNCRTRNLHEKISNCLVSVTQKATIPNH